MVVSGRGSVPLEKLPGHLQAGGESPGPCNSQAVPAQPGIGLSLFKSGLGSGMPGRRRQGPDPLRAGLGRLPQTDKNGRREFLNSNKRARHSKLSVAFEIVTEK